MTIARVRFQLADSWDNLGNIEDTLGLKDQSQ